MGAEMQDRIRTEILAQIAVEGTEGVSRRKALLEQQPHRVALVAEGRLHADEDISEMRAENENVAPVGLVPAGSRAPLRFDLGQPALLADMLVGRHAMRDIGIGAEALRVAVENAASQVVDIGGQVDLVAAGFQRRECIVQRLEHRQIRRGTGRAGIRRKIEQHDGELALRALRPAQRDEFGNPCCQHRGAFAMGGHGASRVRIGF